MLSASDAGRRAQELARQRHKKPVDMNTLLAHSGIVSDGHNDPLAPPMHMSTTFTRPADGIFSESDAIYSRMHNHTRLLLEREVGRLECYGREHDEVICCAFASGMMAASGIILAHDARSSLRVLLPRDCYHGVSSVCYDVFTRFGVVVERVDMRDTAALEATLKQSDTDTIVWIETPSNPMCDVLDIQSTCDLVRKDSSAPVTIVVDSTLAPPTIQQPLLLGADLVLHSATKYMGGHSDALAGIVTASPWTERGKTIGPVLRRTQVAVGGVASTLDSWLVLRGLRSLNVRVRQQCATALHLAKHLENHPLVKELHYPGLETAVKSHSTAKKQMRHFGGVLSVEFRSEAEAMAFAGALQVIHRATSLGGTETLIEHRASIEPEGHVSSPPGLLRISVGLEEVADLVEDVDHALEIVPMVC